MLRKERPVKKKFLLFSLIAGTLLLILPSACSVQGGAADDVDEAVQALLEEGMSCNAQAMILKLNPEDSRAVRDAVRAQLGPQRLSDLIDNREICDAASLGMAEENNGETGTVQQAITGTYTVVSIPELSTQSVGWSPVSINRDSSSYGYMCGPWYEVPADYIAEFHGVSNAYSSPSGLRIMGLNADGDCYISSSIGSRIYSDNDIRSCFGYWTVWNCGGTFDTGDVRIYRY